jgi:hypothetical protein
MTIPNELRSTLELLQRGFPNGVDESDIVPLCRILQDDGEMSIRTTASVLGELLGCDPVVMLPLIDRSTMDDLAGSYRVGEIREHLKQYGFEEWLNEE